MPDRHQHERGFPDRLRRSAMRASEYPSSRAPPSAPGAVRSDGDRHREAERTRELEPPERRMLRKVMAPASRRRIRKTSSKSRHGAPARRPP
jgi:tRNA(His) 5'-end guanylyltransferase